MKVATTALVWIAGPDRIAHAAGKALKPPRTACGARPVDIRLAWPKGSRCPDCLRALGFIGEP